EAGLVQIGPGGEPGACDDLTGMIELLRRDLRERVVAILEIVIDRQRRTDDGDRDETPLVVRKGGDGLLQPDAERRAAVGRVALVDEEAHRAALDERIDEAAVLRHVVLED